MNRNSVGAEIVHHPVKHFRAADGRSGTRLNYELNDTSIAQSTNDALPFRCRQ